MAAKPSIKINFQGDKRKIPELKNIGIRRPGIKRAKNIVLSKNDMIILISSSGKSKNIINAAKYCKNKSIDLITLSGFKKNNPLKKLGNINFYINSNQYNFIEMCHHIILVYLVDIFAKKK